MCAGIYLFSFYESLYYSKVFYSFLYDSDVILIFFCRDIRKLIEAIFVKNL